MPHRSTDITIRALDGLQLVGTLVTPDGPTQRAVVMVHGGGVTRDEGGFFTRLAAGLADTDVAALRYDQRGHGESEGSQRDRTLAEHLNDIRVAINQTRHATGLTAVSLLGTSFGGGLAAYYAAKRPDDVSRLVLLNPQLNYKDRYIDQKPHWQGDYLDDEAATQLREQGYLSHSATVKHSRAFLNEVFWLRPDEVVGEIAAPTLIVHGTKDTFVSIDSSRRVAAQLKGEHRLIEVDGAQHGFAVHDDPKYADPQTQAWQAQVITDVCSWLTA
jgi:pimeloyl-ACP methyl ester carboxylesterase